MHITNRSIASCFTFVYCCVICVQFDVVDHVFYFIICIILNIKLFYCRSFCKFLNKSFFASRSVILSIRFGTLSRKHTHLTGLIKAAVLDEVNSPGLLRKKHISETLYSNVTKTPRSKYEGSSKG